MNVFFDRINKNCGVIRIKGNVKDGGPPTKIVKEPTSSSILKNLHKWVDGKNKKQWG
jgi:hypothetical protein